MTDARQKKWQRPQLIIFARSGGGERIFGACKIIDLSGNPYSDHAGCDDNGCHVGSEPGVCVIWTCVEWIES